MDLAKALNWRAWRNSCWRAFRHVRRWWLWLLSEDRSAPAAHPTGWQTVDLATLGNAASAWGIRPSPSCVSVTWANHPMLRASSSFAPLTLATAGSAIPSGAFVGVGRPAKPGERPNPYRLIGKRPVLAVPSTDVVQRASAARSTANDNLRLGRPAHRRIRGLVRDVFFIAVLGASLFGAWQSGRMAGIQNVIVVPDTGRPASRIT